MNSLAQIADQAPSALSQDTPRFCLLGASLDTGNRGVSALAESTLAGIKKVHPAAEIVVFDNGFGQSRQSTIVAGRRIAIERFGLRTSKRVYRNDSLRRVLASARLGLTSNPAVRAVRSCALALDISGGDSFSDIYGRTRLHGVVGHKRLPLLTGTPLRLLPQTYGPFASTTAARIATEVLRTADSAWARDPDSFERLRVLLEDDFDPTRHRLGVDVAFALEPAEPDLDHALQAAVESDPANLVGLNVSGLLYNDPSARERYGLRCDYRDALLTIAEGLIRNGQRLLLVPHVEAPEDSGESDRAACKDLIERLPTSARTASLLAPRGLSAAELKWLIGRCSWFCGTRMHSTIASLGSGVPTIGIAYSPKMRGIFEDCDQHDQVLDARELGSDQLTARVIDAAEQRGRVRPSIASAVRPVVDRAVRQWDELLAPLPLHPPQ